MAEEEGKKWAAVDMLLHDLKETQAEVGTLREAHDRSFFLGDKLSACLHAASRCAQAHLQALCPSGEVGGWEEGMKKVSRQEFVCGIGVTLHEASLRLADGRKSLGPVVRVVQVRAGQHLYANQPVAASLCWQSEVFALHRASCC